MSGEHYRVVTVGGRRALQRWLTCIGEALEEVAPELSKDQRLAIVSHVAFALADDGFILTKVPFADTPKD